MLAVILDDGKPFALDGAGPEDAAVRLRQTLTAAAREPLDEVRGACPVRRLAEIWSCWPLLPH